MMWRLDVWNFPELFLPCGFDSSLAESLAVEPRTQRVTVIFLISFLSTKYNRERYSFYTLFFLLTIVPESHCTRSEIFLILFRNFIVFQHWFQPLFYIWIWNYFSIFSNLLCVAGMKTFVHKYFLLDVYIHIN